MATLKVLAYLCIFQFLVIDCLELDQRGNYFMLAFLNGHNELTTNSITITSEYEADVQISIPAINERIKQHILPGTSFQIKLDHYPGVTSVGKPELKGISVLSSNPISVYGNILRKKSAEGYLAIPVNALSTRYRAFSYSVDGDNSIGQIGVIGVQNDTSVVFNYKPGTTCNSTTYIRETINTYLINAYEVLKMTCESNMTGILIHSTNPVAVLTGQDCPNFDVERCSYLIEMAVPTSSFDTSFVLQPSVSDSNFSIYRVVTNDQSTTLSLSNGGIYEVKSENFHDIKVYRDEPLNLESTSPIMVAEISGLHVLDGDLGRDNFMSIVPPISGFSEFYLIDTTMLLFDKRGFQAYITVLTTSLSMQYFSFVDRSTVINITTSNFASATFPATANKIFVKSNTPFGVINYGFGPEGTYGYPGGMKFEDFSGLAECEENTACGNVGICVEIGYFYRCFCSSGFWAQLCENDPTTTTTSLTSAISDEQTTSSESVKTASSYSSVGSTNMSTEQMSTDVSSSLKTEHTTTQNPSSGNGMRTQTSSPEIPTTLMTPSFNTCICLCQVGLKNGEDVEDNTDLLKKELAVEPRILSANVRKKISISDERPSASSIGYIGVVVLIFVFGSIITMDILTFIGNECTVRPALI